ncbi:MULTISPECIES: DUF488 family protein [Micrococcaceae]|uniref:DNA repair protein n=1 Tax=Arthrobacter rhombi TaxID=71253 RepID=A0A1R4FA20_9MICC|nr:MULTISPECIES: DUF488 domain-containing protein [Micrococcaceae]PCC24181.1 DUF488 domain-containing protein [Glutamicibacter sp. BW78]SJM52726.1 hypothetical protein FM101_02930 [Arthrobacter rhombi]
MAAERSGNEPAGTMWTIGHWTCPPAVVAATLESAGIELLVDVRKMPGSRRSPQFDEEQMPGWLAECGIEYHHLPELGGRRHRQQDIDPMINAGWQNASFKNYADHTLTEEFENGVDRLLRWAGERRVVVMCGEPMPWRCHRLLIANVLAARGWKVVHLSNTSKPTEHELGRWGAEPTVDDDGVVTYPA